MNNLLLCDTCVLIDFINENNLLLSQLTKKNFTLFINSIIEMELLQGAHDKKELQKIEQKLNIFRKLELNQNIFNIATDLIRKYALSHSLNLADAVIGVTSLVYDVPLLTYNIKDFKYLPDIQLWHPSAL
ncbi:MAG: type II toxin-antitoxin system VapC family toxin [Desulfobacterales bacterium]|nr:type II toxin-antitoxin system VapC family toxin [Desulfobacterales bacterium]